MSTLASVVLRDITANRPAASIAGRLFFDTTLVKMQRDNGSSWDDVAESASVASYVTAEVAASANLTLAVAEADVAGATITFTPDTNEILLTWAMWDVDVTTGGTAVCQLRTYIDATMAAEAHVKCASAGRWSVYAHSRDALNASEEYIVKLVGARTSTNGTHVVQAGFTTLLIMRIPA
jgi:hypothetical protein